MDLIEKFDLNENDLITLDGLVNNRTEWNLLLKLYQRQIAKFWDELRRTPPANSDLVLSNHKLAVGVEASLGDLVTEVEEIYRNRQYREETKFPVIIEDQTKSLFE